MSEDETTLSSQHSSNTSVVRPAYYTPTIEEFHNGFEYEIFKDLGCREEKTWHKQIFGQDGYYPELLDYMRSGNLDNFRVKYIDRKDCMSLNLEEIVWYNGGGYFQKGNYTIGIYSTGIFCTVSQNDYGNNIMRFSGDLKNKSELKRVLQQVGCISK